MNNAEYYEQIENAGSTNRIEIQTRSLGQFLKEARLWNGLTQKQVAKELNIPYQDYQRYEYDMLIPCQLKITKLVKILNLNTKNVMSLVVKAKMVR